MKIRAAAFAVCRPRPSWRARRSIFGKSHASAERADREPCFSRAAPLRCMFCQNMEISAGGFGRRIDAARLRGIFEELIADGANNINLVSPTPYIPWILKALTSRCWCR